MRRWAIFGLIGTLVALAGTLAVKPEWSALIGLGGEQSACLEPRLWLWDPEADDGGCFFEPKICPGPEGDCDAEPRLWTNRDISFQYRG